MEMQKMQKMQKTLTSDAPDLERTLKVGKIVSKSDKKSLGHWRFHIRFFQSVSNISCYAWYKIVPELTLHNSFVESFSSISFFEHELPTLEKNAMSYCVAFTRDLYAIAVPYSRGGRSEAQHNIRRTPLGEQGVMRTLCSCFLTLFRPQRELRGGPPLPPTLSKRRPKIQRKITSKKTPNFSQTWSQIDPRWVPKSSQNL